MTDIGEIDKVITVFISYSWDNEEHKVWVLHLADMLTDNRIHVFLDRYDLKAGKSMTHFMEKSVNQADKVLLIMTPNYKDKADNRLGGVGYEYSMITQEFYEKQENDKFIPIRRNGKFDECAPKFLKSFISHDMTKDLTFDNDFEALLRIIYDEPEIKRPPLGKKPSFISKSSIKTSISLIDDSANLVKCNMKTFAKWTIDFQLTSLIDQNKSSLFRQISSNIIINKEKGTLPYILHNNNKVSHQPHIIYEIPLHNYDAYNHLMHEKLSIEDGLVHYEFSEYGDQDIWLLFILQPFSTIFYLILILNLVHKQLSRAIDFSIDISFISDRESLLYKNYSPFEYSSIYSLQSMSIPDNKAKISLEFSEITKDSVFKAMEKLHSIFCAKNQKSQHPYISLDRQHFDKMTDEFFK
ncbi:MAG: toll/interleukin-1 receptor domain-containing protein [Bacteroidales bacterium]|nr:toll/interleukin-1 receptor domain-containing protein [Bacteroidales bacterium]